MHIPTVSHARAYVLHVNRLHLAPPCTGCTNTLDTLAQPKPEVVEGNQGCHKKDSSFDISYTKFHELNSMLPLSVKDFMKHVVTWRIRKNVVFVASWPSLLRSPKGNEVFRGTLTDIKTS